MKGFLTVATGKEMYYVLAHNLLMSYRLHSAEPMPFAILCDRFNEWTADFDEAVIIDNPSRSFLDKVRIIDLSPFDETIFIDADCLAYRDLNGLWDIFKDSPDLGVLGQTYPNDSDEGWWTHENLGDLGDKVGYKMTCQGGMYYVRNNGKDIREFSQLCQEILARYNDFKFKLFPTKPEDENIFTLASAVSGWLPVRDWYELFGYYPEMKVVSIEIKSGKLEYEWTKDPGNVRKDAFFVHFGTYNAKNGWLYNREAFKLRKKPLGLKGLTDRALIRARCAVNGSKPLKALANLVPKGFRERFHRY